MRAFTVALMLALATCAPQHAFSHTAHSGWQYPMDCCGTKDCRVLPVEPKRVLKGEAVMHVDGILREAEEDGWAVYGWYVPDSKTRISPDENSHYCSRNPGEVVWYPDIHLTPGLLEQRGGLSSPGDICFWIGNKDIEKVGMTKTGYTTIRLYNTLMPPQTTTSATTTVTTIVVTPPVVKPPVIEPPVIEPPVVEPPVTQVPVPFGGLLLLTALGILGIIKARS